MGGRSRRIGRGGGYSAAAFVASIGIVSGILGAGGFALAEVIEFDNGASLSVNLTTAYSVGVRAEDPSPKSRDPETDYATVYLLPQIPLLPTLLVGTETPKVYNFDDPNRNFKRGDLITNAFSALAEANFKYEDFGFKVSGNAFYDFVYHSGNSNDEAYPDGINKYAGPPDEFVGGTRYANGGRFRLLDAFAYGTFDIGETSLSLRVGNQVVAWGESLFFGNISFSQGVADATRANSPAAEVKDILLPSPQVSMNWGVTDRLSLIGYYQFDWENTQLDGIGSYFSRADLVGPGAEFAYGSVNPFPSVIQQYASACTLSASIPNCDSLAIPQQIAQLLSNILSQNVLGVGNPDDQRFDVPVIGEKKPNNAAQWGMGFTYLLTDAINTGFYFVKYHEKNPLPVLEISTPRTDIFRKGTVVGAVTSTLCTLLGQDCSGIEAQVTQGVDDIVGAVAPLYLPYSSTITYFDDVKLYGMSASTSIGAVNFGFDFAYRQDAPMLVDGNISGIKAPQPVRGDIWQANLNALYILGSSDYWDSLTLIGEVSVNHVVRHDTLFLYDADGAPLQDGNGNNINEFNELSGDETSWGFQGLAEFAYTDIFPGGWDMFIPVTFGVAFGNPAYSGSLGALSGAGDMRASLGVKLRYLNNLEISVAYNAFFGDYDTVDRPLVDRDYAIASVKYTF